LGCPHLHLPCPPCMFRGFWGGGRIWGIFLRLLQVLVRVLDVLIIWQLVQDLIWVSGCDFLPGVWNLPPWWVSLLWRNHGEAILLCVFIFFGGYFDQGEVSLEVAMLMTSPTSKVNVLVIQGLLLVLILLFKSHRTRECFEIFMWTQILV
jgi:hypothetical protein